MRFFFSSLRQFCLFVTYFYAALLQKGVGKVLCPQRAMVRPPGAILLDGPGAQAESGTCHDWSGVDCSQVPWAVPIQGSLCHVSSEVLRVPGGLRGRHPCMWGVYTVAVLVHGGLLAPLIIENHIHCNIQKYRKVNGIK